MAEERSGRVVRKLSAGLVAMLPLTAAMPVTNAYAEEIPHADTLTGDWGGARSALERQGITVDMTYTGETFRTMSGDIGQGTAFEGLLGIAIEVDLEKVAGWRGATAHVSGLQTHDARGRNAADFAGSISNPSNIDALATTRLFTVWLEQNLGNAGSLRIGQLAADEEFFTSDTASTLINSTFGWANNLAANLPSGGPGYPLAAPGIRGQLNVSDHLTVLAAAFSGDPAGPGCYRNDPDADPEKCNKNGATFSFHGGTLWMGEAQYLVNNTENATGLPGTYKLGAWYHTGRFVDQRFGFDAAGRRVSLADPSVVESARHSGNWGIYGVADQMIWRSAKSSMNAFLRGGASPSDRNPVSWYVDGGFGIKGLIPTRADDTLTFGISYTRLSGDVSNLDRDEAFFTQSPYPVRRGEMTLELTYAMQVTPWWTLQPDLQYIVRPGGGAPRTDDTSRRIDNAFLVGIRSTLDF